MKSVFYALLLFLLLLLPTSSLVSEESFVCSYENNSNFKISKRGCCSRHGGVCGCVKGSIRCCDGSMSPTCTCN